METRHEDIGGTGQSADHFRADLYDLADFGTDRQPFLAFALDRTGIAANALLGILKEVVFAH
jgi:hypothetical protein